MNLLSFLAHEYKTYIFWNEKKTAYNLIFSCEQINDSDVYVDLSLEQIKTLKKNVKQLFVELEYKLPEV